MSAPSEPLRAYSMDEAARQIGVSKDAIRKAVHAGHLRAKRLGGAVDDKGNKIPGTARIVRISDDALRAWFEAQEDA